MELISRILSFTDEQKTVVGLKSPNTNTNTNLVSSFLSTIIGAPQPPPVEMEVTIPDEEISYILHISVQCHCLSSVGDITLLKILDSYIVTCVFCLPCLIGR